MFSRKAYSFLSSKLRRNYANETLNLFLEKMSGKMPEVPYETDIVIVGGGLVGMMCAYFIKQLSPLSYTVTVVDKDLSLKNSATSLYYEGLKQQFMRKDYIQMAKFSADFYRNVHTHLAIQDFQQPDISFVHQGCMFLAQNDDDANTLSKSVAFQKSMGVDVDLLDDKQCQNTFKNWIDSTHICKASLGYANEGYFDVGLLIGALKGKAASMDVKYINGEVVGFGKEGCRVFSKITQRLENRPMLKSLDIKLNSTSKVHTLRFSRCVLAAGHGSSQVAEYAGIGVDHLTDTPLAIKSRLKHVYVLGCMDGPGLDMPMMQFKDFFLRRHNNQAQYICTALHPLGSEDFDSVNYFNNHIRNKITNVIPAFNDVQLLDHWQGYIDYNDFDNGLVVGNHPFFLNLFMAAGGPSMELSPGVGNLVMEMMLKNTVEMLEPKNMAFDRIMYNEKAENLV